MLPRMACVPTHLLETRGAQARGSFSAACAGGATDEFCSVTSMRCWVARRKRSGAFAKRGTPLFVPCVWHASGRELSLRGIVTDIRWRAVLRDVTLATHQWVALLE